MPLPRVPSTLWTALALAGLQPRVPSASPPINTVRLDFVHPGAAPRPLHGVNKGPLAAGGLLDLTPDVRLLNVPFVRLHDCHWPNPDVVDIHAVFPNMDADPDGPESYDFRLTDEYVAAVRATGAQIIFRLGESIEHTSVKRFANPPADPEKWARIAAGIVGHYNAGWAGGFRCGIRYWEIWNEPDNRPACWTGTDEQYFRLYAAAAHRIKAEFPDVQVGGPGVGNTGSLVAGKLAPSPFVSRFLDFCRRERAPLDFFSWHCYTKRVDELTERAREVRRLLDERGFAATASHLTEWNYLPDGDWAALSRAASPLQRKRFYERMAGPEGAAFVVAALVRLQGAPVDVCCLFHGETGGFGLFDSYGMPNSVWRGLRAYSRVVMGGRSVRVYGDRNSELAVAATLSPDGRSAAILIAKTGPDRNSVRLKAEGFEIAGADMDAAVVSPARDQSESRLRKATPRRGEIVIELEGPSVVALHLTGRTRAISSAARNR